MNNKYDLGNFAKLLESFTPKQEMDNLDQYLFGASVSKTKVDPRLLDGDVDRSLVGLIIESGTDANAIKKASVISSGSNSSSVPDTEPKSTEVSQPDEAPEKPEPEEYLTIQEDAFIPKVSNPKFEFVPYQPQMVSSQASQQESMQQSVTRICESNMLTKNCDLNKMSPAQLREPPKNTLDFLSDNADLKAKRWTLCTESDKKEIIYFLMLKIFCCTY